MTISEDIKKCVEEMPFVHHCGTISGYNGMFTQVEAFVTDIEDAHNKINAMLREQFPDRKFWTMVIKHHEIPPAKQN